MKKIHTHQAPAALGPYSQAVSAPLSGQIIFVSGQLPIDLTTGKLINGSIAEMTDLVIKHIENILFSAGADLSHVVRTDVFLKDLADFATFNAAYQKHFTSPIPPARQTFQAAALPLDSPVEISCIAVIPQTASRS